MKIKDCNRNHNKIADGMGKNCRISNDSVNITRIFPPPNYCMNTYLAECMNLLTLL